MSATTTDGKKPKAEPVNIDAIPELLRAIIQWVVWRYVADRDPETGETHWDKPPVNANSGKLASSTNRATWSDFATAEAAYGRGNLDGVGFVLARQASDNTVGVVAIDLDDCRNPETGTIEQWALDIIQAINSYTEVSPSGRGIRIFLIGRLPKHGRKKDRYENYENARYVTVTGQRVEGTPVTVEERQEQLLKIHQEVFGPEPAAAPARSGPSTPSNLADAEIIEKASAVKKNGDKFRRLWNGDWSGYESQSNADLALTDYLAFWCGPNEERIAELLAQSGLNRPKWDRPDYRHRNIQKVLTTRTTFYDPDHFRPKWRPRYSPGSNGNGNGHHQPPDEQPPPPETSDEDGGEGGKEQGKRIKTCPA